MFQKSVAIYLVLFIGVGIDPGCCLRAWISNSFAAVLTSPFPNEVSNSEAGTSGDGSACCAENCCAHEDGSAHEDRSFEESATSHFETAGASSCSVGFFQSSCCLRHATKIPVGECEWEGENGCRCSLSKPLATFSHDGTPWTPILLSFWMPETIALTAGAFPASYQGTPIWFASPPERLAELCRWNC